MIKTQLKSLLSTFLVTSFTGSALLLSCGPKDSVEDNETNTDKNKSDQRSRLTAGQPAGTSLQQCRLPLEPGIVLDPKRPGLTQTVLTTAVGTQCTQSREAKISIRSRQKITLVGQFNCRTGAQPQEQFCTGNAADLFTVQKTTISIPIIVDETLQTSEFEAWIELL